MNNDSEAFNTFWANWPNRKAKGEARKAWRQVNGESHFEAIMQAIPAYVADVQSKQWLNWCHPASWLRGERWEDEYDEPARPPRVTNRVVAQKPAEGENHPANTPIRPAPAREASDRARSAASRVLTTRLTFSGWAPQNESGGGVASVASPSRGRPDRSWNPCPGRTAPGPSGSWPGTGTPGRSAGW